MIDTIRAQLHGTHWDLSLASPIHREITEKVRTLASARDAQLQLFTTPNENGSIRCGLEVVYGTVAFRNRLAASIRDYICKQELPSSLLVSQGATICRLKDKSSYTADARIRNAQTFYSFLNRQLQKWLDEGFETFSRQETNSHTTLHSDFEHYLREDNKDGSGKASSYLRGLDLLEQMLRIESFDFADCQDLWSVNDSGRLTDLRSFVLEEQKKPTSPWFAENIPVSYLRDGHCAAALTQLIEFQLRHQYTLKTQEIYEAHTGTDTELAAKLSFEPVIPDGYVNDSKSKDGQDRIREVKTRIGQDDFRKRILAIYQNRCCITGLNIPALNRASHIIGWAERKATRMLPSNGLCLSATYDAAFDKKLISLDEDYRLIVSNELQEHYTNDTAKTYFQDREGQAITLPVRDKPNQKYLQEHRNAGSF